MAKSEKDSKSEAIPGGSKPSDISKEFGGTKGVTNPAPSVPAEALKDVTPTDAESLAPVTTDASAKTPVPPTASAAVPRRPADVVGTNEIDLDAPNPPLPKMSGGKRLKPLDDDFDDEDAPTAGKAGDKDPLTVTDFLGNVREFIGAVKTRDWPRAFRSAGGLVLIFSDLMDTGGFNLFGTMDAAVNIDKLGVELDRCRNDLSQVVAAGRGPNWAGGDPHPLSGSPMPQGVPMGADSAAIDPQLLLVLFELAKKLYDAFKRNRG